MLANIHYLLGCCYFKYPLRFAKNQEETAKANDLARDLIDKDVNNFWKTVYKMNTSSNIQAKVIDGITRPDNIADYAESVILIKCGEYLK